MSIDDFRLAIYDWKTWHGFLLPIIFPEAIRIDAEPGESAESVSSRIPEGISHFAFHLCVSRTHRFPLNRDALVATLRRRGIKIVNAFIVDVTKRHIQFVNEQAGLTSSRVGFQGAKDERLILKSNYNYGAEAERRLTAEVRRMLELEEVPRLVENSRSYQVLARQDVPPCAWADPSVAVERFIENDAHMFFRVYVSGQHVAISRVRDSSTFKKMPIGIKRETAFLRRSARTLRAVSLPFDCSPNLLRILGEFIYAFRLDFGALDVVHEDPDTFCIVDVNNTPHWGDGGHPNLLAYLREGLRVARLSPEGSCDPE